MDRNIGGVIDNDDWQWLKVRSYVSDGGEEWRSRKGDGVSEGEDGSQRW